MPDILSLPGLLPTYPFWIRALMFGFALAWIVAYAILLFVAPKPPAAALTLSTFQQAISTKWPTSLVFDLTLINNTGATLATTKAEIIYYKDDVTRSGVFSKVSVPSVYTIATDENGLVVSSGSGFVNRVNVTLDKPFGNSKQMEVSIPIAEVIEDKKSAHLFIMLHDAKPVDTSLNKAQITLHYGDARVIVSQTDIKVP